MDNKVTNKNYSGITFLKLAFTILIIFHHFTNGAFHGYIAVEFFFMASGVFLYKTFATKNLSTKDYFVNRVKKLYPNYILSFVLLYLFGLLFNSFSLSDVNNVWQPILEALMLQNIGIPAGGGFNFPAWYLSVLITASPLIYLALKNIKKKYFNIGACSFVTLIYLVLIFNFGKLESWDYFLYIFYMPWWRGFADILLGVLLAQVAEKINVKNVSLMRISEFLIFALIISAVFIKSNVLDFVCIPLFATLILFNLQDNSSSLFAIIGNNKFTNFMSKCEYPMYLNHALIYYVGMYCFYAITEANSFLLASLSIVYALTAILVVISFNVYLVRRQKYKTKNSN